MQKKVAERLVRRLMGEVYVEQKTCDALQAAIVKLERRRQRLEA
jgi:hypothetical protein